MNAHTPGPWTATGNDGHGIVIVETQWGSVARAMRVGCELQEAANARLIASAPELLLALEELLSERYALEEPEEFDEAGNWTSNSPASVKARAAISKAKGGA